MIDTAEKECLLANIRRLASTLNALESRSGGPLIFYGPSRHLVVSGQDGTMAKSYRNHERFNDEIANLVAFGEINDVRGKLLEEINGPDGTYIGLPTINPAFDLSRFDPKSQNGAPLISIYSTITGDSLYDMTIKGTATFEDYIKAAVQIARIQQEGKIHKEKLGLEDVVKKARTQGEKDTDYFVRRRFQEVFLKQLTEYGEVQIPHPQQQLMSIDWETLVAENLVRTHLRGNNGYYFDGNPRHHIYDGDRRNVVSFDFEYKKYVPALLGLASLLSFGLTKDGNPYLGLEEQTKILDRFLLEIEFANALHGKARDKTKRIAEYIKNRKEVYNSDLSGQDSEEFFRFLDIYDDKERGATERREFLSGWQFALLDRNAAWLGHKARYRAVAEFLLGENLFREMGIKFDIEDPVRQNAVEQRMHLDNILSVLDDLQQKTTIKNGRSTQDAAKRLYYNFGELTAHPYFSLR